MSTKSEVINLRIDKKVLEMVRHQAKLERRTVVKQIEYMIMTGASVLEARQPFVLAVFPQGADEQDVDKVLEGVRGMQVATTPQVKK